MSKHHSIIIRIISIIVLHTFCLTQGGIAAPYFTTSKLRTLVLSERSSKAADEVTAALTGEAGVKGAGEADDYRGRCVTADTMLPIVKIEHQGTSAPEHQLKPIIEVKPGDYVLSLNEATQRIEPHRINALLDMGVKQVYRLTTASGRSIKTTANHPYLVRNQPAPARMNGGPGKPGHRNQKKPFLVSGYCNLVTPERSEGKWTKVSELKAGDEIGVPNKEAMARSGMLLFNAALVLSNSLNSKIYSNKKDNTQSYKTNHDNPLNLFMQNCPHNKKTHSCDRNTDLHYQWSLEDKVAEQKPYYKKFEYIQKCFTQTLTLFICQFHQLSLYHIIATLSRCFKNKGVAYAQTISGEYSDILWDKIVSIEPLGREQVYDIEVDGTHNFIGNGIFAHNTYVKEPAPRTAPAGGTEAKMAGEAAAVSMLLITDREDIENEVERLRAEYRFSNANLVCIKIPEGEEVSIDRISSIKISAGGFTIVRYIFNNNNWSNAIRINLMGLGTAKEIQKPSDLEEEVKTMA